MTKIKWTPRQVALPVAIFIVGISFVALGLTRYPVFVVAGVLYIVIGIRGIRALSRSATPAPSNSDTQAATLDRDFVR